MLDIKEAKAKAFKKVFGNYAPNEKGGVSYNLDVNDKELELFSVVADLMRKGIELDYQISVGNLPANTIQKADENIQEDLNKFFSKTRTLYITGRRYSFKEWVEVMIDLLDELD